MTGQRCGINMSSWISDERKIIFIHLTKTGGSSIEKILKTQADFRPLKDTILKDFSQWKSMVNHEPDLEDKMKTYTIFTIVRNPVDRFISAYNDFFHTRNKQVYVDADVSITNAINEKDTMRGKYIGFYAHAYVPMVDSLPPLSYIDYVLRFEHYAKDVNMVLRDLGIEYKSQIPHVRKSRHVVGRRNLTRQQRKKLYQYFKEDYIAFGYEEEI